MLGAVKPSLEFILRQFRSYPGLYVVGAGTSAGTAPLGRSFWTASSLDPGPRRHSKSLHRQSCSVAEGGIIDVMKMATMEKFHFRRALDPESPDVCVEYRWID